MGKENMRYFGHVGCDECPPSMKDWNEENGDRVAGQASNMAAAYNSYQSAVDDYNKQTGDGDKTLTPPAFGDNWDAIIYNADGFDAMGAWAWDTVEGAYHDKTGVGAWMKRCSRRADRPNADIQLMSLVVEPMEEEQ